MKAKEGNKNLIHIYVYVPVNWKAKRKKNLTNCWWKHSNNNNNQKKTLPSIIKMRKCVGIKFHLQNFRACDVPSENFILLYTNHLCSVYHIILLPLLYRKPFPKKKIEKDFTIQQFSFYEMMEVKISVSEYNSVLSLNDINQMKNVCKLKKWLCNKSYSRHSATVSWLFITCPP